MGSKIQRVHPRVSSPLPRLHFCRILSGHVFRQASTRSKCQLVIDGRMFDVHDTLLDGYIMKEYRVLKLRCRRPRLASLLASRQHYRTAPYHVWQQRQANIWSRGLREEAVGLLLLSPTLVLPFLQGSSLGRALLSMFNPSRARGRTAPVNAQPRVSPVESEVRWYSRKAFASSAHAELGGRCLRYA